MSETGSGSIADFRARAHWLARTEDIGLPARASGRWLRDMSSLGHCEVDWKSGIWAVAPAAVSRLPMADGLAVLIGARRPRLMRALRENGIWLEKASRAVPDGELPLPMTIYLPFESEVDLVAELQPVDLTYVGCAADRIARSLGPTAPVDIAAPPSRTNPLERLIALYPKSWGPVRATETNAPDGLYREQVNGRWVYLFRIVGKWHACSLASGVFAELARQGHTALRWRPDVARAASDTGTVFVDWGASLPPLQSRAFALCSGLAPRFGSSAETVIFDNVPRSIAARVFTSLGQMLTIDEARRQPN